MSWAEDNGYDSYDVEDFASGDATQFKQSNLNDKFIKERGEQDMSETTSGVVQKVDLIGPLLVQKEGQNKGKTFHIHETHVNNLKIKTFDFRQKPVPPCSVNDNVEIVYTETRSISQDGKPQVNRTSNSVVVLDAAPEETYVEYEEVDQCQESEPQKVTPVYTKSQAKRIAVQSAPKSGKPVTIVPVSKDTSMEVSGLLQALIHKHGLSENSETQLRDAVRLKRLIAQELEQNGVV